MERYVFYDGKHRYRRISKRRARQLYENNGASIYMIGHKMRPGFPFSLGMSFRQEVRLEYDIGVHGDYIAKRIKTSFDDAVQDYQWYNCCWETGYYCAFYEVEEVGR